MYIRLSYYQQADIHVKYFISKDFGKEFCMNMGSKKFRKTLFLVSIIVIIILVLGCLIPIPLPVDKKSAGIYWESNNASFQEDSEIIVQGTYLKYIIPAFFSDIFTGKIVISNFEYTQEYSMLKITFDRDNFNTGSLAYIDYATNSHEILGLIGVRGIFDEIAILQSTSTNSGEPENVKVISAPSSSRQEAVNLATLIFSEEFKFQ